MKELTSICVGLSFFLSTCALAEEHFITGKQHATAAVVHGAEGHTRILMEHAKAALEHTLEASLTAKGVQKSHLDAAAKELQVCLDLAGNGHIGAATMHAEAAEKHIKASNK
jgi:hypothetical protein